MAAIKTFDQLKGQTICTIDHNETWDEFDITLTDGRTFRLSHTQDCCESVTLDDVCGDIDDLLNSPLLEAEVACNDNGEWDDSLLGKTIRTEHLIQGKAITLKPYDSGDNEEQEWTFYKLGTIKGCVVLTWRGESNGYYSIEVNFNQIT